MGVFHQVCHHLDQEQSDRYLETPGARETPSMSIPETMTAVQLHCHGDLDQLVYPDGVRTPRLSAPPR